jgi:hypothetical protein
MSFSCRIVAWRQLKFNFYLLNFTVYKVQTRGSKTELEKDHRNIIHEKRKMKFSFQGYYFEMKEKIIEYQLALQKKQHQNLGASLYFNVFIKLKSCLW